MVRSAKAGKLHPDPFRATMNVHSTLPFLLYSTIKDTNNLYWTMNFPITYFTPCFAYNFVTTHYAKTK